VKCTACIWEKNIIFERLPDKSVVRIIKSRRKRWTRNVVLTGIRGMLLWTENMKSSLTETSSEMCGDKRNAYRVLVGNIEGKMITRNMYIILK
jgi:hypothetical protein